jgi:hypothetical protein
MAALSATTAWNETMAFFRREAGLIMPIALLLLAVPSAALQLVVPTPPAGQAPGLGLWVILLPLVVIASIIGTVAISFLALRPGTSVGEGLQVGIRRFLPLLGASILIGIAAFILMIPLALLFIGDVSAGGAVDPGRLSLFVLAFLVISLFFWVRLMLMTPVAAIEGLGPIALIRRSWSLTRGHFWKLLGLFLIVSIIGFIILFVVTTIIGLLVLALAGPMEPGSTSFIVMTILSSLLSAVFSAILITLLSRIYAQLSGEPAARP